MNGPRRAVRIFASVVLPAPGNPMMRIGLRIIAWIRPQIAARRPREIGGELIRGIWSRTSDNPVSKSCSSSHHPNLNHASSTRRSCAQSRSRATARASSAAPMMGQHGCGTSRRALSLRCCRMLRHHPGKSPLACEMPKPARYLPCSPTRHASRAPLGSNSCRSAQNIISSRSFRV